MTPHCSGEGCPIKDKCKRNDYFRKNGFKKYGKNTSFIKPPFKIDRGKFTCDLFWGDAADLLFQQLTGIMLGR